jgi:hypothetical protein
MAAELRTIWNEGVHDMFSEKISQIMEKYFGKRAE